MSYDLILLDLQIGTINATLISVPRSFPFFIVLYDEPISKPKI